MLRIGIGATTATFGGLALYQVKFNLQSEEVMDVTFDSALSAEKTALMLRDPQTPVAIGHEIGPGNIASMGLAKPQWIADDYSAIRLGSLVLSNIASTHKDGVYVHTYRATKNTMDGLNNPICSIDVEYTMTPGGWWPEGCTIRRRVTNFVQKRHVLVPWLTLLQHYWLGLENRAFQNVLRKRLY